jgi:hypothetical protein
MSTIDKMENSWNKIFTYIIYNLNKKMFPKFLGPICDNKK